LAGENSAALNTNSEQPGTSGEDRRALTLDARHSTLRPSRGAITEFVRRAPKRGAAAAGGRKRLLTTFAPSVPVGQHLRPWMEKTFSLKASAHVSFEIQAHAVASIHLPLGSFGVCRRNRWHGASDDSAKRRDSVSGMRSSRLGFFQAISQRRAFRRSKTASPQSGDQLRICPAPSSPGGGDPVKYYLVFRNTSKRQGPARCRGQFPSGILAYIPALPPVTAKN